MFLGRGSYCDPASEHQVIKKRFAVTGGLNCEVNSLHETFGIAQ
jgi:hypothetical protein